MEWLFPKKEYHSRRSVFGTPLWHSHAVEDTVTDVARATPIGVVVDLVQGNDTVYEEAFRIPAGDQGPPAVILPTCTSFERANLNANSLLNFNTTPECKPPNNLPSWLATQRIQFCQNVNNFTKNPGGPGGSCSEINAGQALAKTYCSQGANIKASWCQRQALGDSVYAELASAYCQTDTGKADQWCTCYNVKEGVCDTNPNAAGCADKALAFDPLVNATPEGFKSEWIGREGCYGACTESAGQSKYLPIDETNKCASPISICGPRITADNLTASTINSKCVIAGQEYNEDGYPIGDGAGSVKDSGGGGGGGATPPGSTNFDVLFGEENKTVGVGASFASLSLCCMCIIGLLLMMSSGGNNNGVRMRFRR